MDRFIIKRPHSGKEIDDCSLSQPATRPRLDSSIVQEKASRGNYKEEYTKKFSWLTSDGKCSTCVAFYSSGIPSNSDGTFILRSFNDWYKATGSSAKNNKLLKHQESDIHMAAVGVAQQKQRNPSSVFTQLQNQSAEMKQRNISCLSDYIRMLYFLLKSEIPHFTNFPPLVKLCASMDRSNFLKMWIDGNKENATYLSNDIIAQFTDSIGKWVLLNLKDNLKASPSHLFTLMADESTDVASRIELSICIRYLDMSGSPKESFITMRELQVANATSIKESLKDVITKELELNMTDIVWQGYDGASVFSGKYEGVQAGIMKETSPNAHYIHCRSHCLHLVLVHAAGKVVKVKRLFGLLNSLWRFFSVSPKRMAVFRQMQEILGNKPLSLIQPVNTRWAGIRLYEPLVSALQEVYIEASDYSCEAGGLIAELQCKETAYMLHALNEIMLPVCLFAKQLQSKQMTLLDLPTFLDACVTQVSGFITSSSKPSYATDAEELFSRCSFGFIGECDIKEAHRTTLTPFVQDFLKQLDLRFPQRSLAFCKSATVLFSAKEEMTETEESAIIQQLVDGHSLLTGKVCDLKTEYKCFKNYLSSLIANSSPVPTAYDLMSKMVQPRSVLHESFPLLSSAAVLVLLCPIGTASVERSFSAMNRIVTKLRNRLTPGNIAHLVRIATEAPETLTTEMAEQIVRLWHASEHSRRIAISL